MSRGMCARLERLERIANEKALAGLPKVGDIVETKISGKWARTVVKRLRRFPLDSCWHERRGQLWITLRREGGKGGEGKGPNMSRMPHEIRITGDHATANVFADWLEENDEPIAASKLRAAFPMSATPP